ncbi:MAG: hypothetical protein RL173_1316 [Fibrobacterota bacterium]|jgi:hypothetical protein
MSFEPSLVAADATLQESERCERFSEMLKNIELPETRKRFLAPCMQMLPGNDADTEQVLRTLFYVGTTWRAHLQKVQSLRHLGRLLARQSVGVPFQPEIAQVLDKARAMDLDALRQKLHAAVETGIFPDLEAVAALPLEAACLRQRTSHLADSADPYNMKGMARLLPLLRIFDELADRLEVLHRDAVDGVSQAPDLGLLKFMGEQEYGRAAQILREFPGGGELVELLEIQRKLQFDPPVLSALITLGRTLKLPRPDASWMEILAFFLRSAQPGLVAAWQFRAPVPAHVGKVLERAGIRNQAGTLSFTASGLQLPALLDEHTASIDLSGGRKPPPPDWKGLVLANITRDTLITSFLNNSKCVRVPGLVETVVVNSRSLQILSYIATKRDLYLGHQNKGVPAALLRSRSKIPMNLLRRFMHIRFVSKADLKDLSLRAARTDIQKEVGDYLKTI